VTPELPPATDLDRGRPAVCRDAAAAARCAADGVDVVVVLAEGASLGAPIAGPGRVAIFVVGEGDDPDPGPAMAMAAELFGPPGP
jgi:hypothetical protein